MWVRHGFGDGQGISVLQHKRVSGSFPFSFVVYEAGNRITSSAFMVRL